MSDIVIRDMSGTQVNRFSKLDDQNEGAISSARRVFSDVQSGHNYDVLSELLNTEITINDVSADSFLDGNRSDIQLDDTNGIAVFTIELDDANTSGVTVTVGSAAAGGAIPQGSSAVPQVGGGSTPPGFTSGGMAQVPSSNPLPTAGEDFVGEFHEMDLSELQGKLYGVAINSGSQEGTKFICSSLCAPLDFYEMIEVVGNCWEQEQIHAKVFTLKKTMNEKMQYLDPPTIDYIEARYMDLIADGLLSGALSENKQYVCRAGFFEEPTESVPDAQ